MGRSRRSESPQPSAQRTPLPPGAGAAHPSAERQRRRPSAAAPRTRSGGSAAEPSVRRWAAAPSGAQHIARVAAVVRCYGLGDPRDALSPEIRIFHEQITRTLGDPPNVPSGEIWSGLPPQCPSRLDRSARCIATALAFLLGVCCSARRAPACAFTSHVTTLVPVESHTRKYVSGG